MKRITLLALMLSAFVGTHAQQAHFLSNPCLTPDGQTVIFAFEGDLWKSNIKDGQASRLTAMPGYETNPRVSPDGKWIAFTGAQYGNSDVYVMGVNGGDIKQLTFHSANDLVSSWSWDSKNIYFTSARMGRDGGYTVSINGGTPKKVFGSYFFQYDHNLVEAPNGEIFFNDTWESANQIQRKRYKGAFNPDIQSYNLKTKQHKKYTDWEGKDFGATVDKNGKVYFISDEANGEYNLYALDNGKKTALTKFSTSIKTPNVSANGNRVVFEKDYQLYVYDVAERKTEKLNVSIVRNFVLPKEKDFDVRNAISNFDVSPDGKKLAFVSRGEIFVSDIEGKFIVQVNKGSAERTKEVKWIDNKTLLFNQTKNGFENLYTIAADGSSPLKEITADNRNARSINLNKNRTSAVYLSGRGEVRLLDLKTFQNRVIVKDNEIWGFQNADPYFSPDGEHVVFTVNKNFEQDIFIHSIKQNKTTNITNTAITETDPMFSPDGKYLFFVSSRLKSSYPWGLQEPKIYRLALEKLDEPYRSDKLFDLFKEEKKDTSKKITPPVTTAAFNIDMDNIMERLETVSPAFGSQYLAAVTKSGDKTNVLYVSDHGEGKNALWKTVIEPFEQNKIEKITGSDNAFGYNVVENNGKYFVTLSGNIFKLNLDLNRVDPINIGYTFRRNLKGEFAQIFEETWAQVNENFYDEKFHGIDWNKMKQQYGAYLPYLNTRNDLRVLLNDMLGELNSSHQGFNTTGTDEATPLVNRTMETGLIFENENPYTIKYIARRSNAERKSIDIKAGDVLIKVNDEPVDVNMDRSYYFTKPSLDREVKLTFARNGQPYDVKIHPQASVASNLYDEWIDNNQKFVDTKSNNRIAYSHMKDMQGGELQKFLIDMTQELNDKDALILDLRYNTGGNVHDDVLRFLQQRSYLKWKYREGALTPQGNFTPSDKPIVLLINEQSLSDAEMTAQGFKELKLGKVIGNETYRWIIFTSGAGMVDGSTVRLPSWGCYTLDGKNIEFTGVAPDIKVINTFDDKLNGRDPQLQKAVDEILKQLK